MKFLESINFHYNAWASVFFKYSSIAFWFSFILWTDQETFPDLIVYVNNWYFCSFSFTEFMRFFHLIQFEIIFEIFTKFLDLFLSEHKNAMVTPPSLEKTTILFFYFELIFYVLSFTRNMSRKFKILAMSLLQSCLPCFPLHHGTFISIHRSIGAWFAFK